MQNKDEEYFDLNDDNTESTFIEDDETQKKEESTNKKTDTPNQLDQKQNLSFKQKLKNFLKDLWQNPKKRWSLVAGVFVVLIVLVVTPHSRYFMLNSVGVRSSASVKVLDESTSLPLKNVSVKLAGVEVKTNDEGVAKLEKLKLGNTKLVIHKRAFAELTQDITLGWGSNPLNDQKIKPVGVQYSFDVVDFLSEKPITKAEATSGEYSAISDDKGHIVLTIDQPDVENIDISIKSEGYRVELISQPAENKSTQKIAMVPARKHLFVSKRSGKYDVYKIDADGKNEQLVLSGTGRERDDMALVPRPDKDMAVLVSSRDNTRNKDGYLLSTLTLLDLTGNETQTVSVGMSESIQIIGWSGDSLVYVKVAEGASGSTPDRQRLITYNTSSGDSKEIAKSNYFNDVVMINDRVYYAPSSALQSTPTALYSVKANGEDLKTVFNNEVWNIIRTDYDSFMFGIGDDWYEYKISSGKVLASSGPPSNRATRIYVDNQDKKHSLWIDQRDGKGVLLNYSLDSKEDKIIKTQSGLTYPVVWLSENTIVYRVYSGQENADYVVNIDGGEARKIKDVTATNGIDNWYYY